MRWISHLDLKRTLERAIRRAEIPIQLTQGHNPHPKLSFGPPLPVGATGDAELMAMHLAEPVDPEEIKERLNRQLPPGLEIVEIWSLPPHRRKETFGDIDIAEYYIAIGGLAAPPDLDERVRKLLSSEEVIVQRGGERPERTVDLRPFILGVEVAKTEAKEVILRARLCTGSHGGARPQEIVQLLGLTDDDAVVRYHRSGVYAEVEVASKKPGMWRRWSRSRSGRGRS